MPYISVSDAISYVLPSFVHSATAFITGATGKLLPQEEPIVNRAVPSRRHEFTIGRSSARAAMIQIGIEHVPILQGETGEPIWPNGLVGSITHNKTYVWAAVARSTDVCSLGIDVETHAPIPGEVVPHVLSQCELSVLATSSSEVFVDSVIFSAKEAVIKAFSKYTKRPLSFLDFEVEICLNKDSFSINLKKDLPILLTSNVSGKFVIHQGNVFSACVILPKKT